MTPPLLLIDGASLWFRAFHGVPESLTAPDGRPVNAIRGFTDMVASLITRMRPARLAVCLDLNWRPDFRVEAVPSYKAHRVAEAGGEDAPDALAPQVPVIMELLAAAGIATAGAEGLEADDVLGTLAARERQDTVVVVSGDRDLLQVVSDDPVPVRVLYVGRGLAKAELFGPAEVAERYGVPRDRAGAAYAELATLRGDASDGLPGVGGIGEKTASRLLLEHGSLEAIRAAANGASPTLGNSLRAKITGAADYLDAAIMVTRVVRDAEVQLSKDTLLPREPEHSVELDALAEQWGVTSSVARLRTAMHGPAQ